MSLDPKIVLHGNKVAAGQAIRAARILLDGQMRKDIALGTPVSKVRYVLPTGQIVVATHEYSQTYLDISASSGSSSGSRTSQPSLPFVVVASTSGNAVGIYNNTTLPNEPPYRWLNNQDAAGSPEIMVPTTSTIFNGVVGATTLIPTGKSSQKWLGAPFYVDNKEMAAPIAYDQKNTAALGWPINTATQEWAAHIEPIPMFPFRKFLIFPQSGGVGRETSECPAVLEGCQPPVYIGNGVILCMGGLRTPLTPLLAPGTASLPGAPVAAGPVTNEIPVLSLWAYSTGGDTWTDLGVIPSYQARIATSVTSDMYAMPQIPQINFPNGDVSLSPQVNYPRVRGLTLNYTLETPPYGSWFAGARVTQAGYPVAQMQETPYQYLIMNWANNRIQGPTGFIGSVFPAAGAVSGAPATECELQSGAMKGFTYWSIPANVTTICGFGTDASGNITSTLGNPIQGTAGTAGYTGYPYSTNVSAAAGAAQSILTIGEAVNYLYPPYEFGSPYNGAMPPPPSFYSGAKYPWLLTNSWTGEISASLPPGQAVNPVPTSSNATASLNGYSGPAIAFCSLGVKNSSAGAQGLQTYKATSGEILPDSTTGPYVVNIAPDMGGSTDLVSLIPIPEITVGPGACFMWRGTAPGEAALFTSTDGGVQWGQLTPALTGIPSVTGSLLRVALWGTCPQYYPDQAAGVLYGGDATILAWGVTAWENQFGVSQPTEYTVWWSEDNGSSWTVSTYAAQAVQSTPGTGDFRARTWMAGSGKILFALPGVSGGYLFARGHPPLYLADTSGVIPTIMAAEAQENSLYTDEMWGCLTMWKSPLSAVSPLGVRFFAGANGAPYAVDLIALALKPASHSSFTYPPSWSGDTGQFSTALGGGAGVYKYLGFYAVP